MAPRKRKQPERKRAARRGAGLALRGLAVVGRGLVLTGRLISRHPVSAGGSAIFAVVFSFVAANAMWYQNGTHPSPLLRTRVPLVSPEVAERLAAAKGEPVEQRDVTTFVIEREGDAKAGDAATAGSNERHASLPAQDVPEADAHGSTVSTLVADIQKELARLGFYEGAPDGRSGPKTSAAILRFEKQAGRMETGAPSADLLQALRNAGGSSPAVATPANRPYSDPKTVPAEADPVAAAIRSAEKGNALDPRTEAPVSSEMVMNIQKGLSNLAYADVVVDGVAGDQTRAAIRHFEKHYHLPQTGEPNPKVLKKLKEIGAL
ncbi:peptidoglycan-binding protein [Sinorhizobium meliloti]|uniref:peptidoglycan-binding domain-containing protein n=1 Tax=Rhizobium meliloti TaxID=382 RepID=UPI000FD20739|nr:peptidoglycan-binding protein [Sinorhizobium meliloti]MDW9595558.1 peptidoglycan-binding protein [Sinorhizobium meliloti]MDW9854699.1 peptidoglycan-binding protein [Sinorhizobium meliloti]MDW9873188.1 peptidoglycan-binding protein [Sinorhizobium meliloti]MDW9885875.1 peptidoglycan-binding protein [Sinorhizobium meliloti]MDX0189216.1 peptidoglycan-binding protein [Sinorhizobium meliloti]